MPRVSDADTIAMLAVEWEIVNEYECGDPICDYQGGHQEHIILGVESGGRGVYLGIVDRIKDRSAATFLPTRTLGVFLADYLEAFVAAVGSDSPEARNLLETANVMRMVDWGETHD